MCIYIYRYIYLYIYISVTFSQSQRHAETNHGISRIVEAFLPPGTIQVVTLVKWHSLKQTITMFAQREGKYYKP